MKKVVSLFMAVLMIFSVAAPSFAVSAAELAEASYASDANAVSTTDDAFSDAIGGVVDFFKNAFNTIVNFFKNLFGLNSDAGKYKIIFNTDGGSKMEPLVVEAGKEIPSPSIPVKTGHTFIGWSPALPETMPKYDLEVKALWSVNKYTITFDSNGGTNVDPIVQNYGTAITAPDEPVRSGYKFMGWQKYDSNAQAYVTVDLPAYMPAYNVNYRAAWVETTYKITFLLNEGDNEAYHIISGKKYNSVITDSEKPADPVLEGHTFIGWDHPVPEKMPAKDMVITAVWAENDYTVKFVADNKTLLVLTDKYGTVYDVPSAPVKTGYTFAGWKDANGNSVSGSSVIKKDVIYYADYKADMYNINWVVDGKKTITEVAYGSAIVAPQVSGKEGYEFLSWTPAVPSKMTETRDLTFTAQFKAKDVTLTFLYDDGKEYTTITQGYETKVTAPSNPSKTGYTFTGWDKTVPSKMPLEDMTFTASFNINQYTITFKDTGDTAYNSITADYNTAIDSVADPSKTGYTFQGWDKNVPAYMPAENLTITAQWKINQYTIKFETNGGTAIAPVTQNYGTALTAPATPVKSDYEFIGWAEVESPSVEDKIELPKTVPAKDVTYYAIWRGAEKTVVFNANGGTFVANDEYTTNDKHTVKIRNGDNVGAYLEGNYEINGVKFPKISKVTDGVEYGVLYWATDSKSREDMSNKVPEILELDESVESVEYFAQWSQTYTITLRDGLTNDIIKQETLPAGASIADFYDDIEKDGYVLFGWAENFEPTEDDNVNPYTVMPSKNITYYTIWDAKEYALSFDAMGGVIKTTDDKGEEIVLENPYIIKADYLTDLTDTEDDIADLPADPTREGYIFMGWTLKKGYDYEKIEALIEAEKENAKADNPVALEETLADITEEIPSEMPLDGASYYAMWIRNTYVATYYIVSEDGETPYEFDVVIEDETVHKTAEYATKYGTAIEIPEVDPVREGYQFMGWYDTKEAEGGNNVKNMPMPAKDIKLYARFEKTYSFTFANCKGVNTITAIYGTDIADQLKALAPEKEGHSFDYWNGSDDKQYSTNDFLAAQYPTMPKKNINFTAEWTINTYKIAFNSNGGSAIAPIEQAYNTPITAPGIPVKEGYTFAGWEPAIPDKMPAGGATCIAQWTINQYTITFEDTGDTTINPITQDYKSAVKAPADPERYGYVFTGWVNENGVKVSVPSTMPAEDVTLKATWKLGNFAASFYLDEDGKILYETVIGKNTEAIAAPVINPSKSGYKFMGWSSDGKNVLADLGVFSSDVKFYAVWEANTIKIQFVDFNGNNIGNPIEQTCGESYKLPAEDMLPKAETGYSLIWMNGSSVVDMSKGVPCLADGTTLTYTADTKINQYTITFVTDEDASAVAPITQDYNTDITEPAAPVKTGYTFVGWTIDEVGGAAFVWEYNKIDEEGNLETDENGNPVKVPAKLKKNYTLCANWEINEYTATFDANGGEFADGTTEIKEVVVYNEAVPTPAEPTREGYSFGGWTPSVPDNMPASNVTFEAIWNIVEYDAIFNANGGKFIVDGEEKDIVDFGYDFGESIYEPDVDPFLDGYNFIGWATEKDAEEPLATLGKMEIDGKVFYAVYEIKKDLQYTVETYVMDTTGEYEKTNTGKREAYYGENVDVTPETVEEGFYIDADMSVLTATVKKTNEVVLKIYLARNLYYVAFEGENTEIEESKTGYYYHGSIITEPVDPVVEEYQNFNGWNVVFEDGTSEKASFSYIVTGNVTIVADITTKEWRLDFATAGGSYVDSIEGIAYGTKISEVIANVADPTKDGYTFGGWTYIDEEGQFVLVDSSFTMPNKNCSLTAKWNKNS